ALVGSKAFGERGGGGGRREHGFAPGGELGREGELEAVVVEEGEDEVGRERAGGVGLGDVGLPRFERGEAVGGQGDDADAGQDDGGGAGLGEVGDLLVGEEVFAGLEDPAQVEAVAAATGAGDGFDGDLAGTVEEVGGAVVEFG